jgi:hypothetical protein
LRDRPERLVSIGTGVPTLKSVRDDVLGICATLKSSQLKRKGRAERFRRNKSTLDDKERCFRFNVDHGLEDIGLEELRKRMEMAAATGRYIASQAVSKRMKTCANNLAGR